MVLVSPPESPDPTDAQEEAPRLDGAAVDRLVTPPSLPAATNEADTSEDLSLYGTQAAGPSSGTQGQPGAGLPTLPSDGMGLSPDDWAASKTQVWRSWLQRVIAICVGVILAIGMFGIAAVRMRGRPAPSEGVVSSADPAEPIPETSDRQPPSPTQPTVDESSVDPEAGEPTTDPPELPIVPSPPPSTAVAETTEPIGLPPETTASEEAGPPGLILESPEEATEPGISGSRNLSDLLRQVDGLLADNSDAVGSDVPVDSPPETDLEAMAEPSIARPPPLNTDVAGRLDDVITKFDCDDIALIEFLRFMMEFSTIPITIHNPSLDWLSLSPETPITLHAANRTVAELLTDALTPHHLEFATVNEQLVIRHTSTTEPRKLRERALGVEDLASDAGPVELADMITMVIDPSSWHPAGGEGTIEIDEGKLVVNQDEAVLFRVIFFCEKLRLARGLKTRSHYDRRLFDPILRAQQEQDLLARPVTLTFLRETPLHEIVERLEKSANSRILIDWQSLSDEGWNPQVELVFRTHDQPVSAALRELLTPLGLSHLARGANVLEITSVQAIADEVFVECYPAAEWLAEQSDVAAGLEALAATLGADRFQRTGGPGLLMKDPGGDVLIMRASRDTHQQLMSLLNRKGLH